MSVLFLTADLIFSSRVAAAGQRLGIAVSGVSSVDAAIARIAGDSVRLVILDLSMNNVDAADAVSRIKAVAHDAAIVAYAPHVHEARLAAATNAGCDTVLTRGQFDRQMETLLVQYGGTPQPPASPGDC